MENKFLRIALDTLLSDSKYNPLVIVGNENDYIKYLDVVIDKLNGINKKVSIIDINDILSKLEKNRSFDDYDSNIVILKNIDVINNKVEYHKGFLHFYEKLKRKKISLVITSKIDISELIMDSRIIARLKSGLIVYS